MVRIKWMNQAVNDLLDIKCYIEHHSPFYAKRTIDKFKSRTKILKQYPEIGRVVPEFEDTSVRELVEGNYRIIYHKFLEKEIWILAVIHSARDLKNMDIEIVKPK